MVDADDEVMKRFQLACKGENVKKGVGMVGGVWKSEKYTWQKNVNFLSSDAFSRKDLAWESGLKTCMCIAHTIDEKFLGIIEFFNDEEWELIPGIVEKI